MTKNQQAQSLPIMTTLTDSERIARLEKLVLALLYIAGENNNEYRIPRMRALIPEINALALEVGNTEDVKLR